MTKKRKGVQEEGVRYVPKFDSQGNPLPVPGLTRQFGGVSNGLEKPQRRVTTDSVRRALAAVRSGTDYAGTSMKA